VTDLEKNGSCSNLHVVSGRKGNLSGMRKFKGDRRVVSQTINAAERKGKGRVKSSVVPQEVYESKKHHDKSTAYYWRQTVQDWHDLKSL